ncbi:MAG: Rid family detoxifying hydrolase, partial [Candidatus Caldarchaeum sp.]|nr:Rid family detoxifying hydrolase [Candidatus Caldarchaeum sp.]MDW7978795.1 Rid family detoxifying hydrolase [Candidatus Caldarchaeum sp.]
MPKQILTSDKAPKPVGPYSQAVKAGNFIFLAGQVALNPATGKFEETDVRGQTRRILENAKGLLETYGYSLSDVVKATVYLTRPEHFQEMNEVYREYFRDGPPARTTV